MSISIRSQTDEVSKHMMSFHPHPLITSDCLLWCVVCESTGFGIGYQCSECDLMIHTHCVEPFINKPFQCSHFLKFFPYTDDGVRTCNFCPSTGLIAGCMMCNIKMCSRCVQSQPPRTIFQEKHHEHSLTLLSRLVTFTCNACGVQGYRNPYMCYQCDMMVHECCINLPRVISINRHDHRISHTFRLGQREEEGDHWECGVCRKTIDWGYGAYKCSRCPGYAVHSLCATREEVWDGKELEDVPEEEEIIEDPFTVVNENGDIIHFSHENHILRKMDENSVTDARCSCCLFFINSDPCYKCVECKFILHEACANLPRKKRVIVHNHKLTLQVDGSLLFYCEPCNSACNGFRYTCSEDVCKGGFRYDSRNTYKKGFDVRCCSLSEPFQHDLHPQHPLYYTLEGLKKCKACGEETENPYRCAESDCDYTLCIYCAILPKKVKNRYDDHFLRINQGAGNASGDLWCDVCEKKTDPSVRYYTCDECGVALHIDCVLSEGLWNLDGGVFNIPYFDTPLPFEILLNTGVTRPLCSRCGSRCISPFFMRYYHEAFGFLYFCRGLCTF